MARDLLARLTPLAQADAAAARLVRLLALEVALASDDAVRAAALMKAGGAGLAGDAGSSGPQRRPELFLSAQFVMQGAQPSQLSDVAQRLQVWVLAHPQDAQAWQLLSSACAAQGQTLRAIRADAEAQMARLDYPAALERFKAAQELLRQTRSNTAAADHIDASIIDTRRRQVELLVKEQALER